MEPDSESVMLEPNLENLLNHALGSGEAAGAVNFITLKTILESILHKLNLTNDPPKSSIFDKSQSDVQNRLEKLEKLIEDLTRPTSPGSLITESQQGNGAIQRDWEVTKLRKRLEANEQGVDRALKMLEELANQIQDVKTDVEQTKKRIKDEQDSQDAAIAWNESTIKALDEKITKFNDLPRAKSAHSKHSAAGVASEEFDELSDRIQEIEKRVRKQDSAIRNCVNWDQINQSFMVDFFKEEKSGDDLCATERSGYPFFFNGLQTMSDLGTKLDEMLRDGGDNESLSSFRTASSASMKVKQSALRVLETYVVPDKDLNTSRTVILAEQQVSADTHIPDVDELLKENDQLRFDIEKMRSQTGGGGRSSRGARMSIFSRKSIAGEGSIPSIVSISERLQECEEYCEDFEGSIEKHTSSLDKHTQQISDLFKLKNGMDIIYSDLAALKQFMEKQSKQTNNTDDGPQKMVQTLQEKMSGTENELARLADIIRELSVDGDQKNRELDQLQQLLNDLQDRAAMRETVDSTLDKKANTEDLAGMLVRDDLDATAQAIVNQLQDFINKQAETEAHLQSSIAEVGAQVKCQTTKDEFDPFKNEMEARLRQLRKKIESSKKEKLDLTTAEGAAGFRRQLFNCISCNNGISMIANRPILPDASAFPARLSLRPHFGQAPAHHFFYSQLVRDSQAVEAQRNRPKSAYARQDGDGRSGSRSPTGVTSPDHQMREHTSNYSTLLAERERERRRKQIENKIRQEMHPYSFQSGLFPRQAGGAIQPLSKLPEPFSIEKDKEERFERLKRSKSLNLDLEADLEGTDGHLYKGRIKKLPSLKRKETKEPVDFEISNSYSEKS